MFPLRFIFKQSVKFVQFVLFILALSVPVTSLGEFSDTCGAEWISYNLIPDGDELDSIVWAEELLLYAAIGQNGRIYTSYDGIEWNLEDSVTVGNAITSIAWNGNVFVATGTNVIFISRDGINWEQATITSPNNYSLWKVEFHKVIWGEKFVILSTGGFTLTSSNGYEWETHEFGERLMPILDAVWDGSQFVGVGGNGEETYVMKSEDGVTWGENNIYDADLAHRIIWNGNIYVAYGEQGLILTSNDSTDWNSVTNENSFLVKDMVWGGAQFVATAENGEGASVIVSSDNGENWQELSNLGEDLATSNIVWNGVDYLVKGLAGGYSVPTILISKNATDWQEYVTTSVDFQFNDGLYGNYQYLKVGANGVILRSIDTKTWQAISSGTSNDLYAITWNNEKFVTVGADGVILTSTSTH